MKPALPLALLLAGCAVADAPPPAAPAAEPLGEGLYHAECGGCHALEPGASTAAAPTLARIVGRRIASEPGYNYSPALRRYAEGQPFWTEAALDRFIAGPEAAVPGTEMSYPGLADANARGALIAWLRSR